MKNLPNPFQFDSACIADTPVAQNVAPLPCAIGEVIEPAPGSLQNSRAETAAGVCATATPAAFLFQPDFEAMFDFMMRDFHPRDLDLPLPKFLSDPSPEYLAILSGASHADTDPDHHDRIHLRAADRGARHRA